MKRYLVLFFKGMGMGAANVIPGVSGGTIALITGIFEELITAIKSFDLVALRHLTRGRLRSFASHVKLDFLLAVFGGIFLSILTLARILGFLFENHPVYIWAYFFGLILASIYFVGKRITSWNISVLIVFIAGTAVALGISFLSPAGENQNFFYLMLSGAVAMCSMILPGLSGSFVLILMGEYELVMIESVNELRLEILLPVILGAILGLIAFSHLLAWIFKRYKNQTISLLTGFILGSLAILWPWKEPVFSVDGAGLFLLDSQGEKIIQGYDRYIPEGLDGEVLLAIVLALLGVITIWLLEQSAHRKS